MADKNLFEELLKVNVSEHVEKKPAGKDRDGREKELSYLSWAWAWAEFKKRVPDAQYEVKKFNNLPYVYDELTGYMVFTSVTANGVTHEMWLPVMDSQNRAMKAEPYQIKTKYNTLTVASATMFDINKTIMRCLVKNIAVASGIGLSLYANEDLIDQTEEIATPKTTPKTKAQPAPQQQSQAQIENCMQCGKPIEAGGGMTSAQVAKARFDKYGMPLCGHCAKVMRDKKQANEQRIAEAFENIDVPFEIVEG